MIKLFGGIKALTKQKVICIDTFVFRLHHKWTVLLLLVFCIMVSCRQYFGDPISCIQKDAVPSKVMNTFCWIHATFSLPDAWNKTVGSDVVYPGVDHHKPGQERVFHAYYQWVCFVLLLQAVLFYAPYHFWKAAEGGRMKSLSLELHAPLLDTDTRKKNLEILSQYLKTNWDNHMIYASRFVVSEALALVNVVGQMFLMNTFLGGAFTSLGTRVLQFTEWEQDFRNDPLVQAFPRLTKCTFYDYGSSGDVQKKDALCILPINIINEKIFIFLWFWFLFLAVITCFSLVHRALTGFLPILRYFLLVIRAASSNKRSLEIIVDQASFGDWFLIYLLAKNVEPMHFSSLVSEVAKDLEEDGERLLRRRNADNGAPVAV